MLVKFVFATLAIPAAWAGNTFLGCTGEANAAAYAVLQPGTFTLDACNSQCANNAYNYWSQALSKCYCSDNAPRTSQIMNSAAIGPACPSNLNLPVRVQKISTTFDFIMCSNYIPVPQDPQAYQIQSQSNFANCLEYCRSWRYAIYRPMTEYSNGCFCVNAYEDKGVNHNCLTGYYRVFVHTPEAAASGLARRKRRMEDEMRAANDTSFCPDGMDACRLRGTPNEYECLDTSSELESCGGCLYGSMNENEAVGTNCTTLPGVELGGATCQRGVCVNL